MAARGKTGKKVTSEDQDVARPARTETMLPPVPAPIPASAAVVQDLAYGTARIQPKLEVGRADDPAELAADRSADAVVSDRHAGRRASHTHSPQPVRRAAEIGLEGGAVSPAMQSAITSARSGGSTLPDVVRRDMESALGADFSSVRVHTGPQATALNEDISARAFTLGSDIFFRGGLPDTSTPEGTHLLAHELTHVVQQNPGAARSTVRRDPAVSAPTNVKLRTGDGPATAIGGGADLGTALGTAKPLLPRRPNHKAGAELDPSARAGAKAEVGDAPEQSMDSEQSAREAAPTLSAIPIPGVDGWLEVQDPYKAVVTYRKYTGVLLQNTQKYDQQIESFARFVETDHNRILKAQAAYEGIKGKDAAKKRAEIENSLGAKKLPEGERQNIWLIVLGIAEERTRLGNLARSNANDDVPLIDGVFEKARDAEKTVLTQTGGRSVKHTVDSEKKARYAGKADKQTKHAGRAAQMGDAVAIAQDLGLAVREAYLSEARLKIKALELAAHKTKIEDAVSAWDMTKGIAAFVGKKVVGVVTGVATAGVVAIEDAAEGEAGAAGDLTGMKAVPIWTRLDREFDKVIELTEKKPYGRANSLHIALQVFNVVLREVRNIAGGIALLLGLLGMGVALVAPPVAAVIQAVAVTLGLIAIAITAAKVVIDGILAGWSAIQRAASSNARNNNLLEAQALSQGGEMIADVVATGMAFGAPALGNAGALSSGNTFLNPVQQIQHAGATGAMTSSLAATGGRSGAMIAGQTAATTGTGIVSKIGATVAGTAIADSVQTGRDQHKRFGGPKKPVSNPASVPADPDRAKIPAARNEPDWIKKGRASEDATRDAAIGSLVKNHVKRMGEFHEKTQRLMQMAGKGKDGAGVATAKLATTPKKDEESSLSTAGSMAAKVELVAAGLDSGAVELSNVEVLKQEVAAG